MDANRIALENEVAYSIAFNELNARFYGALKGTIAFANLAAGTSAVAGLLAAVPGLIPAAAVVVAIASIVEQLAHVADRAAHFRVAARSFRHLERRLPSLSTQAAMDELLAMRADFDFGLRALEPAAWNLMCRRRGYVGHEMRLTVWQRCLAALA